MSRCPTCNWTRHELVAHSKPVPCPACGGTGTVETANLCRNGHAIDIVGRYDDGRCKECVRAYQREYWHRRKRTASHLSGGRPVWGPGSPSSPATGG